MTLKEVAYALSIGNKVHDLGPRMTLTVQIFLEFCTVVCLLLH